MKKIELAGDAAYRFSETAIPLTRAILETGAVHLERTGQSGQSIHIDGNGHAAGLSEFARAPGQANTGNIGRGMGAKLVRRIAANLVELNHARHGRRENIAWAARAAP